MMQDASLISVEDVASQLGTSVRSVWRWSRSRADFPKPIKISDRCTRWRSGDLAEFERTQCKRRDASRQSALSTPRPAMTLRQQRFVGHYQHHHNATLAARQAGYSQRSARSIGSENLAKPVIRERINEKLDTQPAQVSAPEKSPAEWLLDQLVEMMHADMADLYDENGAIKPIREWPLIWRQGLVTSIEMRIKKATGTKPETRVVRLRMLNRMRIVSLIGKHNLVNAFVK